MPKPSIKRQDISKNPVEFVLAIYCWVGTLP